MVLRTASVVAVAVGLAACTPAGAASSLLGPGSAGPRVRALQERLAALSYLPGSAVGGRYDQRTWHAVVALQGWSGIARDGIVGPRTRAALRRAERPVPWSRRAGMEVHVREQVLLLVARGRTRRAVHVSTGAGGRTPLGHFRITRRERMSWSAAFQTWMPYAQYFHAGYAIHEYPSVPAYPASHGCVRVPAQESGAVWAFGRLGMRVWIAAGAHASAGPAARDASSSTRAAESC